MSKAKVLVALRDADHVDGLMHLAWEMSKGMDADVTALNVVEVGPGLPLDAESDVLDRSGKEALARNANLPDSIDEVKVKAEYKDGQLTLTMPKREEGKPKAIKINVGKA